MPEGKGPIDKNALGEELEGALKKLIGKDEPGGGEPGPAPEPKPAPAESGEANGGEPPQELVINPDKLATAKIRIKDGDVIKEIPVSNLLAEAQKVRELEMKARILEEKAKALEGLAAKPAQPPSGDLDISGLAGGEPESQLAKELAEVKAKLSEFEQETTARKIEEFRRQRMQEAEAGLDAYPIFKESPALRDVAKLTLEGFLDARPDLDTAEVVGYVAKKLTEVARQREQRLLERAEKRRSLGGGPAPGQQTIQVPSNLKKEDLRSGKVKDLIEEVLRKRT